MGMILQTLVQFLQGRLCGLRFGWSIKPFIATATAATIASTTATVIGKTRRGKGRRGRQGKSCIGFLRLHRLAIVPFLLHRIFC